MVKKAIDPHFLLNSNMEELLDEAIKNDWPMQDFGIWCLFKIAQNIEKIAYKSDV